ncbi:GntR family transcriptional regulator [Alkalihalobacillus sp. TS-13]|uniref:GntR family transcriptional regulator n=1 Tax=Alkalihalobacillus sp. TS-13 TaxID=2842455 RepID=UPI001C876267|nr:GntR family transcriptional regulator [Alkalihalobacillus sp. TS-13]
MTKITTLSIRESVFRQVRKDILNHSLKPGDKIIEADLADQLGVSRTPVREALHRLEQEGLVEIHPRKFCLVKGVTSDCIKEIHLIRSQLEPLAARYAVDHLTDDELHYLKMLIRQSEKYAETLDVESLMRVNDEFHQTIIKASKFTRIIKILENMHDYVVSFRYSFMSRKGLVNRSIKEHHEIYEALANRDKEAVQKAVSNHLKGISEYEEVVLEDLETELVEEN